MTASNLPCGTGGGDMAAVSPASPAALAKWFKARPLWMQDAARRLLKNGRLADDDIKELVVLCKREAGIEVKEPKELAALPPAEGSFEKSPPPTSLRLNAIAEVTGVNRLAPKKPLEFGSEPLTIVYGSNGSGKSGYMRLLKHICGARAKGALHGNVFLEAQLQKSCKVSYTLNQVTKDVQWTPDSGVVSDLRAVCIYDTESAQVYVNEENEVAYEPALLAFCRLLVEACGSVDGALSEEIRANHSTPPSLPLDLWPTKWAAWVRGLDRFTTTAEIEAHCSWGTELGDHLSALNKRIAEPNPADIAKTLRKSNAHLTSLVDSLAALEKNLDDSSFEALLNAASAATRLRLAADVDAKRVFENAPLEGIASDSWRLLWEQARAYSETQAYKGKEFPYLGDDAKCVLCQQLLQEDTIGRLRAFEDFVKGALEREAADAEKRLVGLRSVVDQVISDEDVNVQLDLGGVSDETQRDSLRAYCDLLRKRKDSFLAVTNAEELQPLPQVGALTGLTEIISKREELAKTLDEDAKAGAKNQLQQELNELRAQQWGSQYKEALLAERIRLNSVYLLEEARRLTNTKVISDKSSDLAEVLVTTAFRNRFEKELKVLRASWIGARIEKTKTTKGHVWHQVQLPEMQAPAKTAEILSEGEMRIVSIAAFLADMETEAGGAPFVFDDPISSLDQNFEESAAARLIELCKSRQVIVFTHRLSLLATLEDAAEKAQIATRILSLQKEQWGTGEPGEPPLPAQTTKKALNTLIGQRLQKARKALEEQGTAAYTVEAKALCSDVRITIERLIEYDLLADVVQRFRRPITTLNKIGKLARIKASDCAFLDGMMTKYSFFEHSQPLEAPVTLPEPNDLADDLQKLKTWQDEFASRAVPSPAASTE